MARNDPQVNLRMPADLKDRLDAAAEQSKRSLTAEVVARLEDSFSGRLENMDRENERLSDRLERIERNLQRMMSSVTKEIERQRDVRADPTRRSPELVARREGQAAFRDDPDGPYINPYPKDDVRHWNFRSGFANAAKMRLRSEDELLQKFPELADDR